MQRQATVVLLAIALMASLSLSGRAQDAGRSSAQAPAKVDFAKDVMPLFRQNCLECHGPKKQENGMRLDRRSSVMKFHARRVMPGSSPNSMVYQRLIGEEYGTQMPGSTRVPTGRTRSPTR
jgi:hypothetical protein